MKGLIQKDIFLILGKTKSILILLAVGIMMCFSTDGEFVVIYLTLLAAIMSISTISYDEYDNGLPFLFSLPITRKEYVLSKYVFGLIMGLIGTIGGSTLTYLISAILNKTIAISIVETIISSITFLLVMLGIMIPLQLKFGAEKSRIVIMIVAAACTSIGYLGGNILPNLISIDLSQISLTDSQIGLFIGIFALVLIIVSYFISLKVMNNKEL